MIQFMLSKKGIISLLFSLPFLMGGSCDKQKFEGIADVNQIVTYENISTDRTTFRTATLTTSDIKRNLSIPDDATITEVLIVGLGIRIRKNSDNTAETIRTSGAITGSDGLQQILWDKTTSDTGHATRHENINSTVREGVNKLKVILEEALIVNQFRSYTLILDVDPGFDRFSADVDIIINVEIEWEQCIETWDFVADGEKCSDE